MGTHRQADIQHTFAVGTHLIGIMQVRLVIYYPEYMIMKCVEIEHRISAKGWKCACC